MEVINYEVVDKDKTIGLVDIRIPILKPTVLILRKIAHVANGEKKWFRYPNYTKNWPDNPTYHKFYEFETPSHNAYILDNLSERVKEYCRVNQIAGSERIGECSNEEFLPF